MEDSLTHLQRRGRARQGKRCCTAPRQDFIGMFLWCISEGQKRLPEKRVAFLDIPISYARRQLRLKSGKLLDDYD